MIRIVIIFVFLFLNTPLKTRAQAGNLSAKAVVADAPGNRIVIVQNTSEEIL